MYHLFLFGYKNWDSSLSTETGYIQDGQVSVTSKGSVFSVCHDIQATLRSTQSPPLHTAKQPLHGTLHHSTTHIHGKYYLCHNTMNIFNICHYKLFTNIIKNRLNEHVKEEMVEEQCGFKRDVAVPMLYSRCNR